MNAKGVIARAWQAGCIACGLGAVHVAAAPAEAETRSIVVHDRGALYAALVVAVPGQHLHVSTSRIDLDEPLIVPDGVAVSGDGKMLVDATGTPVGFAPGSVTTLRVVRGFTSDVVTLGDGASISGLRIEQLADDAARASAEHGNVVAIVSRRAGDRVSAAIRDCEIVNPNPDAANIAGPGGRAILLLTRHRVAGQIAETHKGASVSATIERTIVRSRTGGTSVFANNFAARGRVALTLRNNLLEGSLALVGGTTRLDEVFDAMTTIESSNNVFRMPTSAGQITSPGWLLLGGTSSPHATGPLPAVLRNALRMSSANDRIEGFRLGVQAAAARRMKDTAGPVSGNRVELDLVGISIRTVDADITAVGVAAADLSLHGAIAGTGYGTYSTFAIGDDNELRARITGASGSGLRANVFSNVTGPFLPSTRGRGNRLIVVGDASAFARANPSIEPVPSCLCWQPDVGQ